MIYYFIIYGAVILPYSLSQSIYAIPNAVGWPVIMTVASPPSFANTTFKWEFPTSNKQSCVTDGRMNVQPCVGKVVDHVFDTPGMHHIVVTMSAPNTAPTMLTLDIEIVTKDKYPQVQRPEIRKVEQERWDRYLTALYILKDLGIWDHLSAIHRRSFGEGKYDPKSRRGSAHAGPSFPFWHRAQIKVVERCMQHASGDNTLALPYFDWRKGWTGVEKFFGGDGDPNNEYIVTDGPFCNDPRQTESKKCPKRWVLPPEYPHKSRALQRKFGNDSNFHFQTETEYEKLLSIDQYDLGTFDDKSPATSFRSALEGWPVSEHRDASFGHNHNGLHRWIAGTMGRVEHSLNDPMFITHHCNVDRLLTLWQERKGCDGGENSAKCYRPQPGDPDLKPEMAGTAKENGQIVLRSHMPNDPTFPWGIKIVDLLEANNGYKYLDPDETPRKLDDVKPNLPDPNAGNRTVNAPRRNNADQTQVNFGLAFIFIYILCVHI